MSGQSGEAHAGTGLLQRLHWPRTSSTSAPTGLLDIVGMGRVQASLAELEKRLSRIDREQFKARTLAEAQMERFAAALDMLRTADAHREGELEARRTQNEAVIIPRKRCSICCTSWRMRRANADWPAEWHILWPDGS